MRLEILNAIDGVEFKQAFKGRTVDRIDGQIVNLIGLKDLKLNELPLAARKIWTTWSWCSFKAVLQRAARLNHARMLRLGDAEKDLTQIGFGVVRRATGEIAA